MSVKIIDDDVDVTDLMNDLINNEEYIHELCEMIDLWGVEALTESEQYVLMKAGIL